MSISISFLDSAQAARSFEGPTVRIGRSRDMDMVIPGDLCPGVSSAHCELEQRGERLFLRDLDAANGTYLNGKRISGEEPLHSGDTITLGANGPSLRVGLAADGPTMKAAKVPDQLAPKTGRKKAVGMGTMLLLLDKERARGRRLLIVGIGLVGLLACLGLAYIYLDLRDTRDEVAAGSQRLEALDAAQRKQASMLQEIDRSQAGRIVELMAALQDSDQRLAELAVRQDLDEQGRAKLDTELREHREELLAQLDKAQVRPTPSGNGSGNWGELVKRYSDGVFLCLAADDSSGRVNIGTAFVIDSRGILATNAHVVQQLKSMPTKRVVQNGTGRIFAITRMIAHPKFTQANSPDVGLIRIELGADDELPALPLADDAVLAELPIGSQLGTLGFPGELLAQYLGNVDRERQVFTGVLATFKQGWLGRYTDYQGSYQSDGGNPLIQHSASLSGGTSGSPMFLGNGTVVAISSSTLTDKTKAQEEGAATPTSSQIAFAIRIDELRALITMSGWLE